MVGRKSDTLEWDREFNPQIRIKNEIELTVVEDRLRLREPKTGLVTHTTRYRGRLANYPQLHDFPFDTQVLEIIITSSGHTGKNWFASHPTRKSDLQTFELQEWQVLGLGNPEMTKTEAGESSTGASYPEYHIRVPIRRYYSYYVFSIAAILGLLVSLSYFTSAIPLEDLTQRLTVNILLILAVIAFKYSVSECLPRINYLTVLDKYVMSAFLFLYSMGLENFIVIAFIDDIEKAVHLDQLLSRAWLLS
eukprot:CAMPEP_0174259266 /NCGR_PEP_ID=MMETSP0439-20130205/8113_1 /TAXON_ID=0 /ORGANISM="Stereomyxa ramosa, Strain Chinc5" /LENGTH=248 /DNA_ID=CAMNT_0015343079 /DNA_START=73 /DNA_END=815 /DNA_ORIENTATION=+